MQPSCDRWGLSDDGGILSRSCNNTPSNTLRSSEFGKTVVRQEREKKETKSRLIFLFCRDSGAFPGAYVLATVWWDISNKNHPSTPRQSLNRRPEPTNYPSLNSLTTWPSTEACHNARDCPEFL